MEDIKLLCGDCLVEMDKLIDSGVKVDAVIVDPPYVGMVSEKWDRKTEAEADNFFSLSIEKSEKLLRYGGRLIIFGSNRTQGNIFPNLSKNDLLHRELITIDKGIQVVAGRNTKQYKMHPNCTELINISTKFAASYTKKLLLEINKNNHNFSSKEVNEKLGVKSNGGGMWSIYTGNNICRQVPTKEKWVKFQTIFNELVDFETFEEVFNIKKGIYNIFKDYKFKIKNRCHPTQKPIELMEYLIKTYTNENELILDFCMGSGTTILAAKNLNRRAIGIELDENYFNIAKDRIGYGKVV